MCVCVRVRACVCSKVWVNVSSHCTCGPPLALHMHARTHARTPSGLSLCTQNQDGTHVGTCRLSPYHGLQATSISRLGLGGYCVITAWAAHVTVNTETQYPPSRDGQRARSAWPPVLAVLQSSKPVNMSVLACAGAVSLKSIVVDVPLICTSMKPPPPIPDECEFTTPMHRTLAIAASTALPFCARMPTPTSEHTAASAATAPFL